MSDPLLTTLCRICHVKTHKYRCPRCSTLTCSLPCIKRHKQWAQCNGVRDPTVYIKQKDLATPKGIDHDYNYLTSIEREIDQAEKNASARGIILDEGVRVRGQKFEKGELNLKKALEMCGAIVARAPKGMSRSKQNGTIWNKRHQNLRWSVEWVQLDGTKVLSMVPDDQPISTAYETRLEPLHPHRPMKRRKPNTRDAVALVTEGPVKQHDGLPTCSEIPSATSTEEPSTLDLLQADSEATNNPKDPTSAPSDGNLHGLLQRQTKKRRLSGSFPRSRISTATQQQLQRWNQDLCEKQKSENTDLKWELKAAEDKLETLNKVNPEEADLGSENSESEVEIMTDTPRPTPPLSFHLHHPSLPSPHPVLIPLPSDATLSTSLTNRLVLEFPTIYVLHQRPGDKLPEKFISEEDFFARAEKELEEELEEGEVRVEKVGEADDVGVNEENVDEKRLLEVLGKDLGGVTGVV